MSKLAYYLVGGALALTLAPALHLVLPALVQPALVQPVLAQPAKAPDESVLGALPVTGQQQEHVTTLAVLPSLTAFEHDLTVRTVVRRDLELTGLFKLVADAKAPGGLYGFDDPVDVKAWRAIGTEVIVKVAARPGPDGKVELFGLAYFLSVGEKPVFEKKLTVTPAEVRVTAHRLTDALLGAITGTPGGFASRFAYSSQWGSEHVVLTMDADGHHPEPRTSSDLSSIAPGWGPGGTLFFSQSKNYAPFRLLELATPPLSVKVPFKDSIYGVAFDAPYKRVAVAAADGQGTSIWTADVAGPRDFRNWKRISTQPVAAEPVWSSEGHLAWVGGTPSDWAGQRVFVDGKSVSPAGFSAASPTFCDTEDGVRLVFSVAVGSERRDLVMTSPKGGGLTRLTQSQGSNTSPACSPDGRLVAFFSTRKKHEGKDVTPGLYVMSLKRWVTQRVSGQHGARLKWAALPPVPAAATPAAPAPTPATPATPAAPAAPAPAPSAPRR